MDFPYIPDKFGSMDGASFDFDNFDFRTEAVQSGAGTSAVAKATETTGISSGAFPYPFGSQSDSCLPQLS